MLEKVLNQIEFNYKIIVGLNFFALGVQVLRPVLVVSFYDTTFTSAFCIHSGVLGGVTAGSA